MNSHRVDNIEELNLLGKNPHEEPIKVLMNRLRKINSEDTSLRMNHGEKGFNQ